MSDVFPSLDLFRSDDPAVVLGALRDSYLLLGRIEDEEEFAPDASLLGKTPRAARASGEFSRRLAVAFADPAALGEEG